MKQRTALALAPVVAALVCIPLHAAPVRAATSPHWVKQRSGTVRRLNAISCPTRRDCFAAGNHGMILRTRNAGRKWRSLLNPATGTGRALVAVRCPVPSVCAVVAPPNQILRTVDGGGTWRTISFTLPAGIKSLGAIACPTRPVCYVLGRPQNFVNHASAIFKTANGGKSWVQESVPTNIPCVGDCSTVGYELSWISCQGPKSCLSGGSQFIDSHEGYSSLTLATTNGALWGLRNKQQGPDAAACPTASTCTGICWQPGSVDPGPDLMRTTSGGTTWSFRAITPVYRAVACAGPTFCELAGSNGALGLATGSSVAAQKSPTSQTLFGVACPRKRACYAVGNGGVILARLG